VFSYEVFRYRNCASLFGDNHSSDVPHLLRTPSSSNAVTDLDLDLDRQRLLLIGVSVPSRIAISLDFRRWE
jgi:hypothetical protein